MFHFELETAAIIAPWKKKNSMLNKISKFKQNYFSEHMLLYIALKQNVAWKLCIWKSYNYSPPPPPKRIGCSLYPTDYLPCKSLTLHISLHQDKCFLQPMILFFTITNTNINTKVIQLSPLEQRKTRLYKKNDHLCKIVSICP